MKMEINVIEDKKNKAIFELKDTTFTLGTVLKKELWQDDHVKAAGYSIKHPLVSTPEMLIETDGKKTPQQALIDAAQRLKKEVNKFAKDFQKEVK